MDDKYIDPFAVLDEEHPDTGVDVSQETPSIIDNQQPILGVELKCGRLTLHKEVIDTTTGEKFPILVLYDGIDQPCGWFPLNKDSIRDLIIALDTIDDSITVSIEPEEKLIEEQPPTQE